MVERVRWIGRVPIMVDREQRRENTGRGEGKM
jgi:hypothetical protein